ncbi:MAG: gamma-glutamyltransferase [Acidobacteria bacterium]|nr:gamma-glutamyltransferase [Acidobacteriota bacterium]
MRRLIAVLVCATLAAAQEVSQSGLELQAARAMVSQPERARNGMVASAHETASRIGVDVLRAGGNAVDAAVAVGFALAVIFPEAGNIGGGGYMVVRMADGRAKVFDYRETAPSAARPGLYRDRQEARVGYKASAVPGTVAGLALAHARFGTRPWRELLQPARRLAKDGFPVTYRMEMILRLQVPVMKQFADSRRIFLHGGQQPLAQGEKLRQSDLARTLSRLQKHGWREFYEGETARLIAADMAANHGTITYEDLRGYQALEREPLQGTYRGHPILTAPPSSSGGMAMIEMLNILENFPMPLGMEGSVASRHLFAEAMGRAFHDRALYAADPAFFEVPVVRLTSKEYARSLAQSIRPDRAGATAAISTGGGYESESTTHFSVADRWGNLVANTYTLNGFYGSQVIARGTGVLLNDIMSGFTDREGDRNRIGPGKRPVSSMTPAVLLTRDSKPWAALGSPGSLTIPSTVAQVIVNLIDYKMPVRDAVEFPRIHLQPSNSEINAEPGAIVFDVGERLRSFGHRLAPKLRSQGDVHAVVIDESGWRLGWSDGRRGGRALGY